MINAGEILLDIHLARKEDNSRPWSSSSLLPATLVDTPLSQTTFGNNCELSVTAI
jgi:hypothetical protein